jgi:hypothetical protein
VLVFVLVGELFVIWLVRRESRRLVKKDGG